MSLAIFAVGKHESRSERHTYIPTIDVLRSLRNEGFRPFMVRQTRVRHDDRREYTKDMLRLRHADQITGDEANEIVLLNSHDGTSSYQRLAGVLRFVCQCVRRGLKEMQRTIRLRVRQPPADPCCPPSPLRHLVAAITLSPPRPTDSFAPTAGTAPRCGHYPAI